MHRLIRRCASVAISIFTMTSFGLVIPTQSSNIDVYLGLFGSISNPAMQTGCYNHTTNVLTGKQLIEYQYTAMDCVDTVTKIAPPAAMVSSDSSDDKMRAVLSKASAFQLGLNFSFNS